jgi:hypothetical protein
VLTRYSVLDISPIDHTARMRSYERLAEALRPASAR